MPLPPSRRRSAQRLMWLDTLPPPRDFTVKGWLYKRKMGARKMGDQFDLRYAVYDVVTGMFS